jgi:hypothetical protein
MNVVSYRSPPPEQPESPQVTRKRTWKTTTRETTTSVKQETRTEVETLVPEMPEITSRYYLYDEESGISRKDGDNILWINT